jgi:hypothetical protein
MADPTPTHTPLLDLDTLITGPLIRKGGQEYELRSPDQYSPLEFAHLGKIMRRAGELEALEDPTDDDKVEYDTLIDQFCREVFPAPDLIQMALTKVERVAIVSAFIRLRAQTLSRLQVTGVRVEAPTAPAPEAVSEKTIGVS